MTRLRRILLGLVCCYLLALGVLFAFQRALLFPAHGGYMRPAEAGAPASMQEIDISTDDGLNLKAWYQPATTRRRTIVMFHGNGDTMASFLGLAAPFITAGYGVMLTEYRGYFGMQGSPTESWLYADARTCLRYLAERGVPAQQTILMGHSLGTGIATRMAHEFAVAGVILSAPYTSIMDVAARQYPIFPVRLLMLDHLENIEGIKNIHSPLLILHGDHDRTIPVSNAEAVFAAAAEPKTLKILHGAGHNNLLEYGYGSAVLDWLDLLPKN